MIRICRHAHRRANSRSPSSTIGRRTAAGLPTFPPCLALRLMGGPTSRRPLPSDSGAQADCQSPGARRGCPWSHERILRCRLTKPFPRGRPPRPSVPQRRCYASVGASNARAAPPTVSWNLPAGLISCSPSLIGRRLVPLRGSSSPRSLASSLRICQPAAAISLPTAFPTCLEANCAPVTLTIKTARRTRTPRLCFSLRHDRNPRAIELSALRLRVLAWRPSRHPCNRELPGKRPAHR